MGLTNPKAWTQEAINSQHSTDNTILLIMTPMKLFVTSIAILVMLCNAESDPGSRTLHRKHGGKNGGKLV